MKQHGFPKSARLLRRADYRRVYSEGRRRNLDWLVAFLLPTGRADSRVGLTVPGALGGAVVRNRIKRRLREAVRQHRGAIGPGWDIVLQPRPTVLAQEFGTVQEAVRKLFEGCAQSAQRPANAGDGRGRESKKAQP
jgi:ribonuclease P protein component